MFYIDHQISNPVCQLFGVLVEQIPGFESYPPPKGGWRYDMPEALIVQRETAAYQLLFGDALAANSKGTTRAFAKLLGASVTSNPIIKTPSQSSVQTRSKTIVKQQSILDSMFMATVKLEAAKDVSKTSKDTKKKEIIDTISTMTI
jgi:hypothetical protein